MGNFIPTPWKEDAKTLARDAHSFRRSGYVQSLSISLSQFKTRPSSGAHGAVPDQKLELYHIEDGGRNEIGHICSSATIYGGLGVGRMGMQREQCE